MVLVGLAALVLVGSRVASRADEAPQKLILTKDTAAGLQEYQTKVGSVGHGVFAVSVDGVHWAYWECSQSVCSDARSAQKTKALRDCEESSGGIKCIVLAQDQDVLLEYQTVPVPLASLPDPSSSGTGAAATGQAVEAGTRPPAPPAGQLARINRPGWSVDQLHGCWVWDQNPKTDDEVASWTGACAPDGSATGQGSLERKNIERYAGGMKEGRKDGQGKMVNSYGEQYEGGFRNGKLSGHGKYTWSDGANYEGNYTDDFADGNGTFTEGDKVYSGQWKMGCFDDGQKKYSISMNGKGGCPD